MVRRSAKSSVFAADCPSRDNLCLLGNKWCLLVLRALAGNTLRLVERRVYPEIPVRIEYELTRRAEALARPIEAICRWAERSI